MTTAANSVRLLVQGERALFPRPEFRRDAISYEAITPAAARGILDAVHWRPALRWIVDRIHVLRPITMETSSILERDHQTGRTLILKNVCYILDAHFEMTARAGPDDEPVRHLGMFRRQLRRPVGAFLGKPEFNASIHLLEADERMESTCVEDTDLGWMLHDADYADHGRLRFFRARIVGGAIEVPSSDSPNLFG